MDRAYLVKSAEGYEKLHLGKQVEVWEDGLRTTGAKGEFEWWYYDAKMDDGSTLVLTFFLNNLTDTKGGFHPNIKIELTKVDGTEVSDRVYIDEKDCSFSTEKCDVKMGKNFFTGNLNEYHIYVETDKITADIKLVGSVAPWRMETGFQQYGEEGYFAWLPSVPEGITQASVTVNGVTETYQGTGYHDHNWGNVSMIKILHHWYWGRAKIGPYTFISCYMTSTKKFGYTHFPIFMMAKGEDLICDNLEYLTYEQLDLKYDEKMKKHYYNTLVYTYNGPEGHFKITYKAQSIISSFSLLEDGNKEPSKAETSLLKIIGIDPTYDRFNGDATFERIENGKVIETYTAPATWELMYFGLDKDI